MPRKRGAQGAGTIRQRNDGRWEARYTIGRDPGTGKQVQRSVYGKTQAEVRKKLQAVTTSIDSGVYIEPARLTVGQWCDVWIKEYSAHIKPGTVITYTSQINNHIKPNLGKVKLQALNAHTVQTFCNALQRIDGGKQGLSAKTVKNVHGVLHAALQQAVEIGYIPYNPAGRCKLPRIQKTEISPMDNIMITAFLQAISGHQFERVYLIDIFTGLRESEILGLTWDCVDFEKGSLYVYRQLRKIKGVYQFTPLKNNKTRRITLAPDVLQVFRDQRITQMEWRLKAGPVWQPWEGHSLIFTNEIGDHCAHETVYRHYKRIVAALGVPKLRFHDLRHTYAVASLQAGDDIKTVQENLGHHTAAFTLDTYGHVTEQMKQASANRMQAFIESVKGQK